MTDKTKRRERSTNQEPYLLVVFDGYLLRIDDNTYFDIHLSCYAIVTVY